LTSFLKILEGPANHWSERYRLRRGDGSYAYVMERAYLVRDAHGQPVRMVGAITDVTDQRNAEEGLKVAVQRLGRVLQGTVEAMASAVELRDAYTAGHMSRVARLATAIAHELHLSADQLRAIQLAAALHDLGKVAVPAEILGRPRALSPIEMKIVRAHPDAGSDILKQIEFPWPVAEIVRQHHERLDGSGYPLGLKGEQLMLESRVLAVADVVEAMCSHRPHRPALGMDAALREIEGGAGRLYDPTVVAACVKLMRDKGFSLE
jgi:putative nucleotidyltransferase with HDIG domain